MQVLCELDAPPADRSLPCLSPGLFQYQDIQGIGLGYRSIGLLVYFNTRIFKVLGLVIGLLVYWCISIPGIRPRYGGSLLHIIHQDVQVVLVIS